MNAADTIAAISSAVSPGARMIVRLSGPSAHGIARNLGARELGPARASPEQIWPGVSSWVYAFATPRSYTGEDLVEFHIPGSPILARMILDRIVALGVRPAEPGEFTARAYFNGRIDLTQAEGVAATIAAHSERELLAARQLLSGELARRLSPVMDSLAQTLALIEVGIDFTDEDVTFLPADQIRARIAAATATLDATLAQSARFERLAHEPRIVLVGRPNAGKSTLLNALAGAARAVVSDVAGTTRDAIWAEVRLARGMVRIVDVAGIQERTEAPAPGCEANWEIARQMREQATREVAGADRVVLVIDGSNDDHPMPLERPADLIVHTKADLADIPPTPGSERQRRAGLPLHVSARSGDGMESLRQRLDELAFGPDAGGAGLALNARHVRAIDEARDALARADASVESGGELVALELREALDALGGILGKLSPDDLLGRIFSEFCIGK